MSKAVMGRPPERAPYQPFGAAISMWKSAKPELILCGAANTGKSRACIEKMHFCADKYPNARLLMVRKTRRSLTQTAMVTYEQKVLPKGWLDDSRGNGGQIHWNVGDQQYEYPNGSIIAVAGMDDPQKVMSSEWDMIYVQEATELVENDWESLTTRLRNHKIPYQQLIGDCNPGPPTHWLKMRADRGVTTMLDSRHEDNPACTPEDLARLDALTGVRYLRLRKGLWAAAEGLVYEEWNPEMHVLTRQQLIDARIFDTHGQLMHDTVRAVFASVDFGYTNPGVIQVYALDSDDRSYLVHETYQTQKDIDWWLEQAGKLKERYKIQQFICDPAEPSFIEQFNKKALPAIKAVNDIAPGISQLQARLKPAGDGRPRFFVYQGALAVRDQARVESYQPCGFLGEVLEYCWPEAHEGMPVREVPVKVNDHACLVAGTSVLTRNGNYPIEVISAGDVVLTRNGYCRVKEAGVTEERARVLTVLLSNGTSLTGTANHPVYVQGKGYVEMASLWSGDVTANVVSPDLSFECASVVSVTAEDEPVPVYNLTVDNPIGEGEYFANGVLVHNCDAARYMCMHLAGRYTTSRIVLEEIKERLAARDQIRKKIMDIYW